MIPAYRLLSWLDAPQKAVQNFMQAEVRGPYLRPSHLELYSDLVQQTGRRSHHCRRLRGNRSSYILLSCDTAGLDLHTSIFGWPPQLRGKTDARFVETAFKLLREEFRIKPGMTVKQFLEEVGVLLSACILFGMHACGPQLSAHAGCRALQKGRSCSCKASSSAAENGMPRRCASSDSMQCSGPRCRWFSHGFPLHLAGHHINRALLCSAIASTRVAGLRSQGSQSCLQRCRPLTLSPGDASRQCH
jgi:hypothetical protein